MPSKCLRNELKAQREGISKRERAQWVRTFLSPFVTKNSLSSEFFRFNLDIRNNLETFHFSRNILPFRILITCYRCFLIAWFAYADAFCIIQVIETSSGFSLVQ
jgi:hypothetical protein